MNSIKSLNTSSSNSTGSDKSTLSSTTVELSIGSFRSPSETIVSQVDSKLEWVGSLIGTNGPESTGEIRSKDGIKPSPQSNETDSSLHSRYFCMAKT